MGTRLHLPTLQSLHTKPSWHNRAGRTDRSACFVVTAARLWRMVPDADWRYTTKPPSDASADRIRRQVRRGVARRLPKDLVDRDATISLTARDLWLLHKYEPPKCIAGDHRTPKSNAMNPTNPAGINPNRGVGFSMGLKMLGLDRMWDTTLTIQRIVQHEKLRQHFLVCPACGENNTTPIAAGLRPAGPATRSVAAISTDRSDKLPGRATKLYLPLCTADEYNDALLARLWLQTHTNPNRPLTPEAIRLIERYASFLPPGNSAADNAWGCGMGR